jgi:uroporphyrinogen III methyltransferase/synthase
VAATIAELKLRPPVVVVVGEVVADGPVFDWFRRRELFGQRVLVTRPEHQAGSLIDRLIELGADVMVQPAIEISPAQDRGPLDDAIARLGEFDWVVFSSANGVRFFFDRVLELRRDARSLASARLAAIGPGTADELHHYSLRADLMPADFRAEALAEALSPDASGKRFLLVRASRGREVLAEQLSAAGAQVTQVVAYESLDVASPASEVAEALEAGQIDWITVSSSAIARSLVRMFGDSLRKAKLASISPVTTATLNEVGMTPAAEATEYTMPGLVRAIQAASRR